MYANPEPKAKKDKTVALMNLGMKLVETFFPRYQELAIAVGDVADVFRN